MELNDIKIQYLNLNETSESDYIKFLDQAYKGRREVKYPIRYNWYKAYNEVCIVIALFNNEVIGQSGAFRDVALINGTPKTFWWSFDTYVLPEMRGRKIGYLLQKKLHEDLPNFSSASYTLFNGKSKLRCGARKILMTTVYYYPKDNLITLITSILINHFFKKELHLNNFSHNLYSLVNTIHGSKYTSIKYNDYLSNENAINEFIQTTISNHDFILSRTKERIRWKYYSNPSVKVNNITFYYNKKIVGVFFFSDVYYLNIYNTKKFVSKLLDIFINEKYIDSSMIPLLIFKFYKQHNTIINGILSINKLNFFPRIALTKKPLLSTLIIEKEFMKPYLSLGDADMEQMI